MARPIRPCSIPFRHFALFAYCCFRTAAYNPERSASGVFRLVWNVATMKSWSSFRSLAIASAIAILGVGGAAHAQIVTGTIYGSGYGVNPGDRDSFWRIVAVPSTFTPPDGQTAPYDSYVPYSVPTPSFIGYGTPQAGVTGTIGGVPVTNYWITPTTTTGAIAAPLYKWIAQQTFTVPQTGFYRFDFPAAGDNAIEFFLDGAINQTNPQQPTISGGQQIGGLAGGFGAMTTFTGGAELSAGTHTASMVLWDYGGETGAIIGSSTFAPTVAYWAPGSGAGGNGTWNNSNSFWSPAADGSGTKLPWTSGVGVAYFGGTSGTVSVGENVDVSQIYFTTGGYNIQSGGGGLVWGNGASITARSGTGTISATQTANSGLKIAAGDGTVVLQGTTNLGWLQTLLVDGGRLVMNGTINSPGPGPGYVNVSGGSLSGTGTINNAFGGSGFVSPGPSGTSSGILTATQVSPADGLDFAFVLSGSAPNYADSGNSVNDVLRLTGGTPFASALGSSSSLAVYLNFDVEQLTPGTVIKGGFFTDSSNSFYPMISNLNGDPVGRYQAFVLGDGNGTDAYVNGQSYYNWRTLFGWDQSIFLGTTAETANFGSGNVNGQVMTLTVAVPEPGTAGLALAGIAYGGWTLIGRRKRG
jgi:hypothetical protein